MNVTNTCKELGGALSGSAAVELLYRSSKPKPQTPAYGSIRQFSSHKTISEKKKKLSLGTPSTTVGASLSKIRPTHETEKKLHASVNLEKHIILTKYEKIK
jgi:hypothetical protein